MSGSNKSIILTDEDIRRSGYRVDPFDADGRYVGAPLVRVACRNLLSTRPSANAEPGRSVARIHASRARRVPLRARARRDACRETPSDRPSLPSPPHALPHARGSPRAPNPGLGLVFDAALKKTADPFLP